MDSATRQAVFDAAPDLGLQHAVASVRFGANRSRRAVRWSLDKPAGAAVLFWVGYWYMAPIGDAWAPFPARVAAAWLGVFATVFTLLAFIALAVGVISPTPTHRVVHGRLRAAKGSPWQSTGPGRARIRPTRQQLTREQRKARRDIARAQRTLSRIGARRREYWERQHAAEDWMGAERTKPGRVDRALMDIKPKTKKRKARAGEGQKGRERGRKLRQRLDREYEATAARIAADRIARSEAALPRLDPTGGPPTAPGAEQRPLLDDQQLEHLEAVNARVDAEVAEHRERAAAQVAALIDRHPELAEQINSAVADVQRREWESAGLHTYTPPPTPEPSTSGADR